MLHAVTLTLVLVGAINWGLIGLFSFNLVESLGLPSGLVQTVYVLVGASGLYMLLTHKDECMTCMDMMGKGKKKRK